MLSWGIWQTSKSAAKMSQDVPILQGFYFSSSSPDWLLSSAYVQQAAGQDIGFKLYPGATILCKWLENHYASDERLSSCKRVLELGAGISALPSMLMAAKGKDVVATDCPDVVDFLQRNIDGNRGAFSSFASKEGIGAAEPGGSLFATSLLWGKDSEVPIEHSAKSLLSTTFKPDLILGADIVYHEHLIQPLLDTLLALTEPSMYEGSTPPPIVMAYVQRFKRAKQFFKLAQKHFEIKTVPVFVANTATSSDKPSAGVGAAASVAFNDGGLDCIDYEVLTWTLPTLLKKAGLSAHPNHHHVPLITKDRDSSLPEPSPTTPLLNPSCSFYSELLPLLKAAYEAERAGAEAGGHEAEGSSKSNSLLLPPKGKSPYDKAPAAGSGSADGGDAAGDDNDGDDARSDASSIKPEAAEDVFTAMEAGDLYHDDDSAGSSSNNSSIQAQIASYCHKLHLPAVIQPYRAYVYVFTRKVKVGESREKGGESAATGSS
jgi:protein N-lysine methyltransferase METTL21C